MGDFIVKEEAKQHKSLSDELINFETMPHLAGIHSEEFDDILTEIERELEATAQDKNEGKSKSDSKKS